MAGHRMDAPSRSPGRASARVGPLVRRRRPAPHQPELRRAVVRDDQELATVVLDPILETLLAAPGPGRCGLGAVGRHIPDLGRVPAVRC